MSSKKIIGILSLILFLSSYGFAQDNLFKKETFKVWGNCEMCKKTIEKPLKNLDGIKSANWNVASHKMTVKFDENKVSLTEIKKTIASVGYDTEEFKAPDEVYSKLHHCCQYDRN